MKTSSRSPCRRSRPCRRPPSAQDDDEKHRQRSFRDIVQPRRRSSASTARCSTSIRSGITPRRRSSRRCSRPIRNAASPIGASRSACCGIRMSRRRRRISPRAPPRSPRPRASARRPQRERDYIDALAVMYADHEKVDHRTRVRGLCQGDGGAWRSAIRTTTRRRSTTRSRSTPRPRRPTRPTPTSSKARRSSSRSSSASRSIPASRTI